MRHLLEMATTVVIANVYYRNVDVIINKYYASVAWFIMDI